MAATFVDVLALPPEQSAKSMRLFFEQIEQCDWSLVETWINQMRSVVFDSDPSLQETFTPKQRKVIEAGVVPALMKALMRCSPQNQTFLAGCGEILYYLLMVSITAEEADSVVRLYLYAKTELFSLVLRVFQYGISPAKQCMGFVLQQAAATSWLFLTPHSLFAWSKLVPHLLCFGHQSLQVLRDEIHDYKNFAELIRIRTNDQLNRFAPRYNALNNCLAFSVLGELACTVSAFPPLRMLFMREWMRTVPKDDDSEFCIPEKAEGSSLTWFDLNAMGIEEWRTNKAHPESTTPMSAVEGLLGVLSCPIISYSTPFTRYLSRTLSLSTAQDISNVDLTSPTLSSLPQEFFDSFPKISWACTTEGEREMYDATLREAIKSKKMLDELLVILNKTIRDDNDMELHKMIALFQPYENGSELPPGQKDQIEGMQLSQRMRGLLTFALACMSRVREGAGKLVSNARAMGALKFILHKVITMDALNNKLPADYFSEIKTDWSLEKHIKVTGEYDARRNALNLDDVGLLWDAHSSEGTCDAINYFRSDNSPICIPLGMYTEMSFSQKFEECAGAYVVCYMTPSAMDCVLLTVRNLLALLPSFSLSPSFIDLQTFDLWCKKRAVALKDEGNEMFKEKQWHAAAELYTAAIQMGSSLTFASSCSSSSPAAAPVPLSPSSSSTCPSLPSSSSSSSHSPDISAHPELYTFYSNRAQCFLNLELWQAAKQDAEAALQLKPDHEKSVYRLSQANKYATMYVPD